MYFKMLPFIGLTFISRSLKLVSQSTLRLASVFDNLRALSQAEKDILARNAVFKDKHKGQRAFVIVNGPSLAHQDLSVLKDEITFVVSGFWKHPVVKQWQPTYYSILDAAYFRNEENIQRFYEDLKNNIHDSTFFLPLFLGYEANIANRFLDPDRSFYVATAGDPFPSVDLTSAVQGFQSVSAFALAQAIYMGCNPIYLLGFDHDYLAHRGIDHHFYDGCCLEGHKNATKPISAMYSYDSDMEALLRLWKNYRSLKLVADRNNITILNATQGGYLDVFDRANYRDIFRVPNNENVSPDR